ncbi:hypothetical protein HNQ08_005200 [Deinococcus humi]|uniref:Uncharacterized protein n=1 Tax=Deinococcus humi TaxID=662880 RepID=A0A7W8NG21_9DEIO|nr:hypothetical protein [Deinococcus humi]
MNQYARTTLLVLAFGFASMPARAQDTITTETTVTT